jgi:hypothetical protein
LAKVVGWRAPGATWVINAELESRDAWKESDNYSRVDSATVITGKSSFVYRGYYFDVGIMVTVLQAVLFLGDQNIFCEAGRLIIQR